MQTDASDLREEVRAVYSKVAADPAAHHPFRVGRKLAGRAGYPEEWLSWIPAPSVDSFAGVSCLPCFAEPSHDARVLDLGCGAGLDSLLIAPQVHSVAGFDFSEEMLRVARESAKAAGIPNVEFRLADAERLPVDSGFFDAAVMNGIFNLNHARSQIFRELARVVRPGGMVFAAELILKAPFPSGVEPSPEDWFSWIAGAKEGDAFLREFRKVGFLPIEMSRHPNPRSSNPYVEVARVRARLPSLVP